MRGFLSRFMYAFGRFMYGRYGTDVLSKHLNILAILLLVLSMFVPLVYIAAVAIAVWSTCRVYSKNIPARSRECQRYQRWLTWWKRRFRLLKSRIRDRKTHRFFKCPGCKEYLRVPKGRGEIHVTCPRCRTESVRKT